MKDGKKIITPLRKLLMTVSLDDLFAFIDNLGLQFSFVCERDTKIKRMKIFHKGTLIYEATSNTNSSHAIVADALAKFLIGEKKDIHDYDGGKI